MAETAITGAVLVAVDFSACSLRALDTALRWREASADVTVLHVIDSQLARRMEQTGLLNYKDVIGQMRATAERDLAALTAERQSEPFETMVVEGVPFLEIIKIANDLDSDLIVIGSRGHTGVTELFFGGTAEKVLRGGHRPVLCIP
jgi:nucleotide-binding universal stress UspA family protein